jgi:hypothetical protein
VFFFNAYTNNVLIRRHWTIYALLMLSAVPFHPVYSLRRSIQAVLAPLALLVGVVAFAPTANAQCPYGTQQCGAEYCSDVGWQCCAHVGRPDISCEPGATCTASGCVSSGPSEPDPEPDPGSSCPYGTQQCGESYCSDVDAQCCAHVGRPDLSCELGATCTASGCVSQGYTEPDPGGSCDSGSQPCGSDYCSPIGWECCAYIGRSDVSCEPGSTCSSSGCIADDEEGPVQGEYGCPSGTSQCGDDYCSPYGSTCCAHVKRPDLSCPSGSHCESTGCFSDADDSQVEPTDMYEPGPMPGTSPGGGTTQEGDYTCSSATAGSCNVRYCLRSDYEDCYYEVDGEQVSCDACTDTGALSACAQRAVDVCTDNSESAAPAFSACRASSGNAAGDASWVALALAVLWRRRRSAS